MAVAPGMWLYIGLPQVLLPLWGHQGVAQARGKGDASPKARSGSIPRSSSAAGGQHRAGSVSLCPSPCPSGFVSAARGGGDGETFPPGAAPRCRLGV